MLIRYIKQKLKGSTLVEILVSTVIITTVYLAASTLIVNYAIKRPLSMELQIEFQFLSELEKAPNLILQKDTIDFNNYYIVVHHTKPQDSRLTYINVDLHTTRNFLIGRYHFIRENEETDKP